ncbi:MAG: histone deacetylase family protein [Candidatus Dormibacteria bacterium]
MSRGSPEPLPPLRFFYDELFLRHQAVGHPESPHRLQAITARLRLQPELQTCSWAAAAAAPLEAVARVHSRSHVDSIRDLSTRGGGWIDADTYCGPQSFEVALGAVGAALAAVDAAASSPARPAFALVRPPGHHATPERAMGFCLFNNVAIAARHAQARYGVERLAVLDLDVHHGNGTQDTFYEDPAVLYCSLHQLPLYPGSGGALERGAGEGLGATLNLPLAPGSGPEPWLRALREQALPALRRQRPQLILVSAGFDGLAADPLAQLMLTPQTYREAAALIRGAASELGAAPTVWVLEGGYHLERTAEAASLCALELAGAGAAAQAHRLA